MALSKNKPAAAAAAPGRDFENTDDVVVATPAAPQPTVAPQPAEAQAEVKASPAAEQTANKIASTAIARAQQGSLAVSQKIETILAAQKDALPGIEFGVLPRLVGAQGQIMDADNKQLGSWIHLQLVSWNHSHVASPGDDSAEAKALVRYSRDGVSIDDTGEDVKAYIRKLKEVEGYEDAEVKKYVELIGILEAAEKPSEYVGGMVLVSLSPLARKAFEGYQLQETVKVRLGSRTPDGLDRLRIVAEVKTNGKNSFTLLKTSAQPA